MKKIALSLILLAFAGMCWGEFITTSNKFFFVVTPVPLTLQKSSRPPSDAVSTYVYHGDAEDKGQYAIRVTVYPRPVNNLDLSNLAKGFVSDSDENLLDYHVTKISTGDYAISQTVEMPVNGRKLHTSWLGTTKGNRAYQLIFCNYVDNPDDKTAVSAFFTSIITY